MTPRDRLIVALDLPQEDALSLARELQGTVRWLKVGMTLFYAQGPQIVRELRDLGFDIFLDLKLHDIPHQVGGAAHSVARLGVQLLTVHAAGGQAMVAAAVNGAARGAADVGLARPAVIGITVLTSMDDTALHSIGADRPAGEQVELLARVAMAGGADGVVCSPQEAAAMRSLLGSDAFVVTPGVRPAGSDVGDQSRVATPANALCSGASHLVVGRPITSAKDPVNATLAILSEMEGAQA